MSARWIVLPALMIVQSGCAYFATSHLPYTPLLHRAGQADVSVRTGFAYPGGVPIAVNAAVAVVDGLEIVANGDVNVGSAASHYGGGIGVGAFVPTEVFRLEFIGGLNGGYATGVAVDSFDTGTEYSLSGAYLQPFGQLMLGFELERFIFAGGVRIQGFLADTTAVPEDGSSTLFSGYERAYAEPILTAQFPFDIVRIEITAAMPILFEGDVAPVDRAVFDSGIQFYFGAGVGFQWDAFGEGEPEPEPVEYTPVYAPPPAAPAPAEPIVLPTAPPGYETPSEPAPPPSDGSSERPSEPSEPSGPSEPSEPDPASPFRPIAP